MKRRRKLFHFQYEQGIMGNFVSLTTITHHSPGDNGEHWRHLQLNWFISIYVFILRSFNYTIGTSCAFRKSLSSFNITFCFSYYMTIRKSKYLLSTRGLKPFIHQENQEFKHLWTGRADTHLTPNAK